MAGYDFVEGIDNANHGTLQFFIGVAHGMEQAAVGRTLGSFFVISLLMIQTSLS